ncbi:hypothetical protein EJ05DRAFT_474565 [Pseudovirgaria hyperparasitica]|uniref:Uncharacterized protein n=1 Tax=Pseudovirgaria hyperparasitica TaxID=470096 RepID=A0A6A6WBA6_9PEZI|nr:uncharacterized protein EJ05DRAFT_474565 [Pseudovirgaria hyperparasitica]KAF2759459.1 hypothetical protein EJ05DRAFT_474565 [Pseudovirgaria hyperparasitica]
MSARKVQSGVLSNAYDRARSLIAAETIAISGMVSSCVNPFVSLYTVITSSNHGGEYTQHRDICPTTPTP